MTVSTKDDISPVSILQYHAGDREEARGGEGGGGGGVNET